MAFDNAYFSIGQIDRLSYQDTVIHRLDPRSKVVATAAFILTVVSCGKYETTSLAPFFLFPVLLASLGDIPARFLIKKLVFVSPFAIFVGMFNPVFDTRIVGVLFGVGVSAGWLSFLSLLVKFALTISAALILIATTSFPGVCHGIRRLGAPPLFVSQLLFLYRYLFVLLEEGMRVIRAREMRSFGKRGTGAKVAVRIIGVLFIRTVERSERIYRAMLCRGFAGEIPVLSRHRSGWPDLLFLGLTALGLLAGRFFPLTHMVGRLAQGVLP